MDYIIILANIPFYVEPKSNREIENDGRSERKKTEVDKIQTNFGIGNSQALADIGAYAKYRSFDKRFKHD